MMFGTCEVGKLRRVRPALLVRWLPVLVSLAAFARLVHRLGDKNLWLDEAFSLQRAEGGWGALIRGGLAVSPVPGSPAVTDPHPFVYYALLKLALPFFGSSEFGLRFLSALSATLLIAVTWALARYLVRAGCLPDTAPVWAVILAASNAFLLWYGQEARMYAFVILLAVFSTYLLLRWSAAESRQTPLLAAYGITASLLVGSHYLSLLILPVHAGIVFQRLRRTSRRRAVLGAMGVLALVLLPGGAAVWQILKEPDSVSHFASISFGALATDLLQSFSLGLSEDKNHFWWLEVGCAALALAGAIWAAHHRRAAIHWWVLPAWVVAPAVLLLAVNAWHPAYMNSREMSIISVAFLLLVSAGIGLLWRASRAAAGLVMAVLLLGSFDSSVAYFGAPEFRKGDWSGAGTAMREQIAPGDLLITEPPSWWRLLEYYLPADLLQSGAGKGGGTDWRNLPAPDDPPAQTTVGLAALVGQYHRIWLARAEEASPLADWLSKNTCHVWGQNFESPNSYIRLDLYAPTWPTLDSAPAIIQFPVNAIFGGQIRLLGYDLGERLLPGSAVPLTLYWQPETRAPHRYQYRFNLIRDGDSKQVAVTDSQPNFGCRPTDTWKPGSTVVDYVTVRAPAGVAGDKYHLTLSVYEPESLARLQVEAAGSLTTLENGQVLVLPSLPLAATVSPESS